MKVAPPSRRLSGGRPARRAEGARAPSRQRTGSNATSQRDSLSVRLKLKARGSQPLLRFNNLAQQIRLRLVAHQVRILLAFVIVQLDRAEIVRVFHQQFNGIR
jgi:hypothetical protein